LGIGCAGRILSFAGMTLASAPGKIILFGEHAVVYGRPALAVPVMQVHADVDVAKSSRPGIWINAPDINLHAELDSLPPDHPLAETIHRFFAPASSSQFPEVKMGGQRQIEIKITSTIPVASGLGSGAAVSVALIRALASYFDHLMTNEQVNALAFEVEKIHHGTPSGIDNTVITYAQPVFFIQGQPIETFKVGKAFTIAIGDTGIHAPTRESVADVRKLWETDAERWERVFDTIGNIVQQARQNIENGNMEELGSLMNQNHSRLQEMTVSSPELDKLVEAARASGALGAKMSGGGRGGNMIALVKPDNARSVVRSLKEAGAQNAFITTVTP
jgi:mevalonate kinase